MRLPLAHYPARPRHSLLVSLMLINTLALGVVELLALQRARLRSWMLRL